MKADRSVAGLRGAFACAVLAAALLSCTGRPVSAPPPALGAERFYAKHVAARGIPILSSARVSDRALLAARDMAEGMLSHRPDLAAWLVANDYRIALIAEDEALLDLPDKAHWTKPAPGDPRLTRCEIKHYDERIGALSDREYWDARARGIGGQRMAAAEEDVLGLPSSRYWGETIFVHEMAHSVLYAIEEVDPALYRAIEAAYANALASNLWLDEYTTTTLHEYWAEGTQFWFNSNRLQAFGGRRILDHGDVATYDPRLYAVLGRAYGDAHRLQSDPFHMSPARVPPGPPPVNTAEVC